MNNIIEALSPNSELKRKQRPTWQSNWSTPALALGTCFFVFCILLSVSPLNRLVGSNIFQSLPVMLLTSASHWLPIDLNLADTPRSTQLSTHVLLFFGLMLLAFIISLLCCLAIRSGSGHFHVKQLLFWIWFGAILSGLIFILTPAMLSHDVFVYAGYGRVFAVHLSNPYFVTHIAFPNDPLLLLNDWRNTPAAYGPLWLLFCGLGTFIAGDVPIHYVFLYRTVGLIAHLCNIWLVTNILRLMGRSPRTVILGTLLYAWNPLLLEESALGGHNDIVMLTLLLLGIFLFLRQEQRLSLSLSPLSNWRFYLPPLIAFTLAALIKFTSLPLIALFCILLGRRILNSDPSSPVNWLDIVLRWKPALLTTITAGLISTGIILGFYLPFWVSHSVQEIVFSFTSPASASSGYGSIYSAIREWVSTYGIPELKWPSLLLYPLMFHRTWSTINLIVAACAMLAAILWLWRVPTIRTLALAAVTVLGGILIVTPWFFPWYVTWIIGLALICLPALHERVARTLVAFALVFSLSALSLYLFHRNTEPFGGWIGLKFLSTIGAPLLTVLISCFLRFKGRRSEQSLDIV